MEKLLVEGFSEFGTNNQLYFSSTNVAIVGNGGCILNEENGEFIDSHDVVIRFNNANIEDFKKSTGTKTTDLVINCHVYEELDLKKYGFEAWKSAKHIFDRYTDSRVLYVNTNMPSRGRGPIPGRLPFYVMKKKYFDSCQSSPYQLPKIPTVGFATICCLVRSGFRPNLFGFTVDKKAEWDHYFEKRPSASTSHSHNAEMECLIDLENKGLVKIYR